MRREMRLRRRRSGNLEMQRGSAAAGRANAGEMQVLTILRRPCDPMTRAPARVDDGSRFHRPLFDGKDVSDVWSVRGTGLAAHAKQRVPRRDWEPLNEEGAR